MPKKNIIKPLTPKEYEAYVAELVRQLDFAKTGRIELNQRLKGVRQPGVYEIDIVLEVQLAESLKFLLIVECKNWKRPVDRPVVQKLAQTRDALSADKAAIASPVGFTEEAYTVARSLGVALWVITLQEWTTVNAKAVPDFRFNWEAVRQDKNRDWCTSPPNIILLAVKPRYAPIHPVEDLPSMVGWLRFCDNKHIWKEDVRKSLMTDIAAKLMK